LQTFDGVRLSARWTLPEAAPQAVALIIQGSGTVGLDGDVSGPLTGAGYHGAAAKLSEQLAGLLAREGVASYRFAKRGVDDPTQTVNQTLPIMVRDAASALAVTRARFPRSKVFLVGFSEGALIASLVASENPVDALYLLGLISRPIDDGVAYQFLQWPVALVTNRLDRDHDGELSAAELAVLGEPGLLPLLGPTLSGASWKSIDADKSGTISIEKELVPAYRQTLGVVKYLLTTPSFSGWYQSFKGLAPFSETAKKITAPVHLYQALDDAQVDWGGVAAAQGAFAGTTTLQVFPGLGHCFAPMDGVFGEIKTSGPFDARLLEAVAADLHWRYQVFSNIITQVQKMTTDYSEFHLTFLIQC
jgi:pimeloyl-ACP methyl ester carboxylesterase